MRIKTLKVELWMKLDLDPEWRGYGQLLGVKYPEIVPVFNRDGIYLVSDDCWIELNGRAFKYDNETFKFDLALLDAAEYNESDRKALVSICNTKLATKSQRDLLYRIHSYREIRNTYRRSKLHLSRVVRTCKQKRAMSLRKALL